MRKEVELTISEQANLLIRNANVNISELIDWFSNTRKISIGGGDITDFLRYKENLK